ncbi:MAG: hypothetical protein K0R57_1811 [Paenibacillaceae bacterium]|jgi:hypothetical protein|nr:hypothetical protein [Paenibacillaceae bacterium]
MSMPVYTTGFIDNVLVSGSRRFVQLMIIISNSGLATGTTYLEGYYIMAGVNQQFAAAGNELPPQTNQVYMYPISSMDYFRVELTASLFQVEATIFGISAGGVYTPLPVKQEPIRRITSEYRDDFTLSSADFAVLSFRRRPAIVLPEQYGAALLPQAVEILATRPVRYQLVLGGTVNGTYVNYPTPNTNTLNASTALQVNYTCSTVTGGSVVFSGQGTGLSGAHLNTAVNLIENQLKLPLPHNTAVTLVISSLTASDNIGVTFRMEEQW